MCANNLCLPNGVQCDGHDQCGDGSDEAKQCGAFVVFHSVHVFLSIDSFPWAGGAAAWARSAMAHTKFSLGWLQCIWPSPKIGLYVC